MNSNSNSAKVPTSVRGHSRALDWLFSGVCVGGLLMIVGSLSMAKGYDSGQWICSVGVIFVISSALFIPRFWKRWLSAWRVELSATVR